MPRPSLFRLAAFLVSLLLRAAPAFGQTLAPEDALRRMTLPPEFQARLVAAEPLVRQPVTMTFDDRGRGWVIQYLQYPAPAGLKPVQVDQYLRTTYDRVPEPPPRGPRGADRVTILDDPDEHGRFRKAKDFVTGLNLASGLCLGRGGVYVLQAPYLLFYPDRDGDDAPDGDPEVLLEGFGLEDAHAVGNSLVWGPDGWLYGAQGSTVTAKIRGIEFQQGIWRYHPITRQFELFAEGGGNTWGLDFDRHGDVIAGTNWGGFAMLHQVQGAYYIKGFSKHGPLHNPHTYGYFDHVPYQDFRGGHVTCGGVVYQGGSWPERFEDQYVAANLLSNVVNWHALTPKGSTYTARHGGELMAAHDPRFRPIDCLIGPDGSVNVVDWYDIRANHVDPVDNWDRTTGRIYRIEARQPRSFVRPAGWTAHTGPALAKLPTAELVTLLGHPNAWFRREARRILSERRDPAASPLLKTNLDGKDGRLALESFWTIAASDGFDDALAARTLDHPEEDVRAWTVRLVGDPRQVSSSLRGRLIDLARREASPRVRSQLACTARRLPAADGLPIVRELLRHAEDADDPFLPLLLWWAVEDKAVRDRDRVLALLDDPAAWREPLIRRHLVERIARRYMAEGGEADLAACARLLARAPGPDETRLLVQGMEKALEGRQLARVPPVLEPALAQLTAGNSALGLKFSLRLGSPAAFSRALALAADPRAPAADRLALIEVLGQTGRPDVVPALLGVVTAAGADAVRAAALAAVLGSGDPRVTDTLLSSYAALPGGLRGRAVSGLAARPASARALLDAVDAGRISPKDVPLENLRVMVGHKDDRVKALVEKHWGKVGPLPPGEKVARIRAILHSLGQGKGDLRHGKELFTKHCAVCHTLFGEGNKVGPELTTADRKNRDYMVMNVVDPGAFIRPEYVSYAVSTRDGRTLTGLLVESSPKAVTLLNEKNERTVLARERIEEMTPSPASLMPEKLLDELSEQDVRDLFGYLQSDGPPARAAGPAPAQ